MTINDLSAHFRFVISMPRDYVDAMLRPLLLSLRARSRWQRAINAIRRAFIWNGPDRRHVARISRGLPFNHPSRVWKNSVQRPAPLDGSDMIWPGFDQFKAHSSRTYTHHVNYHDDDDYTPGDGSSLGQGWPTNRIKR